MGKKHMTILIAATLIFAVSCSKAPVANIPQNTDPTPKPAVTQPDNNSINKETAVEGALQPASQGKMTGLQIAIGSTLKEAVDQLGEPIEVQPFEGTSYLSYDDMNIMLDRIVDSTAENAVVSGISVFNNYKLYGVTVGMGMDEIKQILGVPNQEYSDSVEDGGMWKMEYLCGDFQLTFYAENKNSATTAAYLSNVSQEEINEEQ